MNLIDTSEQLLSSFDEGAFDLTKWKGYIDSCVPGVSDLCIKDMQDCLGSGYTWENDYLPVLNAVYSEKTKLQNAIRSFRVVVDDLNEKIIARFGKSVDTDLILYLGLCNGAGWVTTVDNRSVVLLGIEKIIELGWDNIDSMSGLILHEIGHIYQSQYGILNRSFDELPDKFLWQLFTEGIAMVFEQEIVGDPECFHQYDDDWKAWCREHLDHIRKTFCDDLPTMTNSDQRYFGDWVRFEDHGDVGYYLGTCFVRFVLETESFDSIINYDIADVRAAFERFS